MSDSAREHHRQVSAILAEALEREPGAREAFVRAACADRPDLLPDVLELLAEHETDEATGSVFLAPDGSIAEARLQAGLEAGPEFGGVDDAMRAHGALPEIPGYRVLGVLGSGGMGSVYEAEQVSPRRRVAIKVVRDLDRGTEPLRRFRFEAEVLGRLRHPGIAQVYEVGTFASSGGERPYFAMEFVEGGLPITEYAEAESLGVRARADLFRAVCDAVQHGHQRGIIHRDLKPANILIDRRGDVKIIDYGVARATEAATVRASVRTVAGGFIGTVRYMSPEQVGGDPEAVDARTDVYALGVILYELLTGSSPYDLERTSVPGAARIIETREPVRPSSLDRGLRGDAEAILLRALEKNPEARYPSAAALADDIGRWLDDRPVEARAVTTGYLVRKFAARHRGATAAGVAVAAVLVLATAFSAAMAVRATDAARAEREQRESLEDLNGYLAGILTSVTPESTRSSEVTVREMLADAVARIETELGERPGLAAALRHRIGASYLSVGAPAEAEAVLAEALAQREAALGDHPDTLETLVRLADAYLQLGRVPEARDGFERTLAMADRLGVRGASPAAIEAMGGLGIAVAMSGDLARGGALMREAIGDARSAGVSDEQRLTLMNTYATLRTRAGEHDDAIAMMRDIVAERTELLGADHPSTLTSVNNLGTALTNALRYDEAEGVLRENLASRTRVLGADHPETLSAMNNLAIALSRLEKTDEAGTLTEAVLERRIATLGRDHPDTITAAMNLYTHLDRTDRDAEADAVLAEFVPIAERTLEPAHPVRLFAASKLVLSGLRNERYAEAADAARRALATLEPVVGDADWEVGRYRAMLGAALSGMGEYDEAGAMLERGVAVLRAARGEAFPWTRWAEARLAEHRARVEGASGDEAEGDAVAGPDDAAGGAP